MAHIEQEPQSGKVAVVELINIIDIPEMYPTQHQLRHPAMRQYAADTQDSYLDVIAKLSRLNDEEIDMIAEARAACVAEGLSLSSASNHGADYFAHTLGKNLPRVFEYAREAITVGSTLYKKGAKELKSRMARGHQLAAKGRTLKDGDPEADRIIWGHTRGLEPKATIHFVTCHFLERAVSVALQGSADENVRVLGGQKDYFLNAMNDVIRMADARGIGYDEISRIWLTPRDQGGVQWSNPDKQAVYNNVIHPTSMPDKEV